MLALLVVHFVVLLALLIVLSPFMLWFVLHEEELDE